MVLALRLAAGFKRPHQRRFKKRLKNNSGADAVDDSWIPRHWSNPMFGYAHFVSNLPPFLLDEPSWDFHYITEGDAPLDADLPQGAH